MTSPDWMQLRDLLVDNPRRLDIRSTAASGLNVPDATQASPASFDTATAVIEHSRAMQQASRRQGTVLQPQHGSVGKTVLLVESPGVMTGEALSRLELFMACCCKCVCPAPRRASASQTFP